MTRQNKIDEQKQESAPAAESWQGTLFGKESLPFSSEKSSVENVSHDYVLLKTTSEIREFVKKLLTLKEFCFDTETTSINALESELVAMSFSWKKGNGYLIHFPESQKETKAILEIVRPVLEDSGILKIGQNIKFDIQVLC